MIKRLQTQEEVIRLIKISDDVETRYSCERGEWIQFLVNIVADSRVFIIASFNDYEEPTGYALVQNAIIPPLGYYAHVIYAFSPGNKENFAMMEAIREWAISIGAKKISATTRSGGAGRLLKYGFKETDYRILEFELF